MSDNVRKALEAAWLESPSFLVDLPQGRQRTSMSVQEVAVIIAAFLRELNGRGIREIGDLSALIDAVVVAGIDQSHG